MVINRNLFIVLAIIIMVVLLMFQINIVLSAGIALIISIGLYITLSFKESKKRLSLLEEDCDPQAFLASTEKQRASAKGNLKTNTYLDLDKAAGLIAMGDFKKAREVLESIDKSYLSVENGTLLVYTMNYITTLYELGEINQGEKIYKIEIADILSKSRFVPLYKSLLDADRFYFLKKYNKSRELLNEMLNAKFTIGKKMGILYRLAQIDEIDGSIDEALENYNEVASKGNKLWIAEQAKKRIESLNQMK